MSWDLLGWWAFSWFLTTFLPPLADDYVTLEDFVTWVAIMSTIWVFAIAITATVTWL